MIIFLVVLLKILHTGSCNNQVLILKYNRRNDCTNPLVQLKPKITLNEFTYCGQYNFRFLRKSYLMSFYPNLDMRLSISDFEKNIGFLVYDGGSYLFDFKYQNLKTDEWQSICFSISMNQLKIVLNGQILLNDEVDLVTKEIVNPVLSLGGIVTTSEHHLVKRFVGLITDVHLWSKSLNIDNLISITKTNIISNILIPDLFTWPMLNAQSNTTCNEFLVKDENDELLQKKPSQKIMLIEDLKDFDASNYLCQAYGGKLFIPKSHEDLSKISLLLEQSTGNCNDAFLGLKKSSEFITDLDGNVISFAHWGKNQPNGKEYQQCIRIRQDMLYDDVNCSNEICSFCQIHTKNTFKLRGPIPKGAEGQYSVGLGLTTRDTNIRGIQETDCIWNGTWIFGQHLRMEQPTSNMPPVGVHKWNNGHVLKFTQCNEDEFTCDTYGHCIPMDQRCDGNPDCPEDGSDENECKLMSFKKGYDKKYPSSKNKTISISMKVMDITEINELNMDFILEVEVKMKWYDSRIIFRNLKPTHYENQLNNNEEDQIWKPELEFLYSKGIQKHRWSVTIQREELPQINSLTNINEDYLYPGNDNPITKVDYYVVKLGCKFNLGMYPFDTQRCPIIMRRPSSFYNQFVMNWYEPPVIDDLNLTQYDILENVGYDNRSLLKTEMRVELILCRKISYHIVNIYIPTLCLIIIAGLTLFIHYSHFEATIMVALTTMLVTYTLYQSISQYLPQTSYMKMIDIWLFGGLFFPFMIIAILIIMDFLTMKEKNWVIEMKKEGRIRFIMDSLTMKEKNRVIEMKKEGRIRLTSRLFMTSMKISLFVTSVIFCIIYWIYGLHHFFFDCHI